MQPNPKYSVKPLFDRLYQQAAASRASLPAEVLRRRFREILGVDVFGEAGTPVAASTDEVTDCGDYTREKLCLELSPGLLVPCYLLRPKNAAAGPLPTALFFYGHGRGAVDVLGGEDYTGFPPGEDYQHQFPVQLVRAGYLTVVPEIVGFGECYLHETDTGGNLWKCGDLASRCQLYGGSLAGLRVFEAIRCMDYLESRPDADLARLGIMGISGGGLDTAFTAALDRRPKAAVIWGYTNTFHACICSLSHCPDNYVPGLLNLAEMPEIISLIAPRPLLISGGDRDPIFPVEATKEAYEAIKKTYQSLAAEDDLELDIFSGGHFLHAAPGLDFLRRRL